MTTIKIAYEIPEEAVNNLKAELDEVAKRDPNWNGVEFIVERDEFTSVDGADEYKDTGLLHSAVFPAIRS